MAIASCVFGPWALLTRRGRPLPSKAVRAAVLSGVFFGADLALFNTAVMTTSAANATLLGTNAPIFVALGVWLLYRDRPTQAFWSGFALCFCGMLAIVGLDVMRHPQLGLGDLFAVLGSVCYAGYLIYVRNGRRDLDTLRFSAISVGTAAAFLLLVCLVLRTPVWGYPLQSWFALLGLALVTQVVGHLAVAHSLGRLPVAVTSVMLLGQAPVTALLAVPLLGEPLSVLQVAGGALVLAGIYVVNRAPTVRETTEREPLLE